MRSVYHWNDDSNTKERGNSSIDGVVFSRTFDYLAVVDVICLSYMIRANSRIYACQVASSIGIVGLLIVSASVA